MTDEKALWPFHPYEVFRRELTVKGSSRRPIALTAPLRYCALVVCAPRASSPKFALADYDRALAALRGEPSCMKAVIIP